jgi:hypothetical protein
LRFGLRRVAVAERIRFRGRASCGIYIIFRACTAIGEREWHDHHQPQQESDLMEWDTGYFNKEESLGCVITVLISSRPDQRWSETN